jgi:hypothetical protein
MTPTPPVGATAPAIDPLPARERPGATDPPRRGFADRIEPVADAGPRPILDAVRSLERGQRFVDRVVRQALAGRDFSPDELIAIQAGVYRYTQELELFSRLVEKVVSGMRETLRAQT